MNHVKLLDCTLRDGAYLIDKNFGDITIQGIVRGLQDSRIDLIEIGFFQDDGFGNGKTVFKNSEDAKRFIPKDKQGCEFSVLADFSRYSVSNLDEHTEDGIDIIRECFFKKERYEALEACREIKKRGYKLFVQPVDILGYSDSELIEFLELTRKVEPDCFSIVDTFGSMYQEDLHRVFELINNNLPLTCRIGFHSHNNMQLSNALSQEFVRMSIGRRKVVVDGTLSGMGRGAGNTPVELITQYMISRWGYGYNMNALLDVIDDYMENIRSRCSWGYDTQMFLAGCYSAHVNNIAYLMQKNSIRSKEISYILNEIGTQKRKRYDYDLLEKTYMSIMDSEVDDESDFTELGDELCGKTVLVLAPGSSVVRERSTINEFIKSHSPVIISVNYWSGDIYADYVFISSLRRLKYIDCVKNVSRIYTSNIPNELRSEPCRVISFTRLVKCGWDDLDNSTLMLLRLLNMIKVKTVYLAGFDGYSYSGSQMSNYALPEYESDTVSRNPSERNEVVGRMFLDFMRDASIEVHFLTKSYYEAYLNEQ